MTKSQSNTLFGISIVLFAVGLFCFLTFWLMYIGFGLMIFGTILSLLSKKKWYYQLLLIGLPIGFVVITLVRATATPERFLIPDDFRGVVYVVFEQENGMDKEYEGFRRVYRIPESGVLFTQFSENDGAYLSQDFYFVDSNENREKLGVLYSNHFNDPKTINPRPTEPPRDSLAVFNPKTTGRFLASDKQEYYNYKALTVGRYDSIQRFNYLDPEYIEKAKRQQLKK
jgi:hypothetical protein